MDFGGEKISSILSGKEVKIYIIEDSDHHLYFDNPELTSQFILEELSSAVIKWTKPEEEAK